MYTIMIGPRLIPTDGMIFDGSKYLLDKAGIYLNEYQTINDLEDQFIDNHQEPDLIIVLGTPWLWDKCWLSHKYQNTVRFIESFPKAAVVMLGIGSCLPLNALDLVKNDLIENRRHLYDLFNLADDIIVRDVLASQIIENLQPHLLPCPAYYAIQEKVVPGKEPIMIWYDPTIGISQVDWPKDSAMFKHYRQTFLEHFETHVPRVYCINQAEQQLAVEIGLPKPQLINSVSEAKLLLKHSNNILSGRVHLSVPATMIHDNINLMYVDSRASTFYDVQQGFIKQPKDAENDYLSILRKYSGDIWWK